MIYYIVAGLLVAVDQVVKYLVRTGIELGGSVPLIPHVMELTYIQNTGAAFSSFSNSTFLLTTSLPFIESRLDLFSSAPQASARMSSMSTLAKNRFLIL